MVARRVKYQKPWKSVKEWKVVLEKHETKISKDKLCGWLLARGAGHYAEDSVLWLAD